MAREVVPFEQLVVGVKPEGAEVREAKDRIEQLKEVRVACRRSDEKLSCANANDERVVEPASELNLGRLAICKLKSKQIC